MQTRKQTSIKVGPPYLERSQNNTDYLTTLQNRHLKVDKNINIVTLKKLITFDSDFFKLYSDGVEVEVL